MKLFTSFYLWILLSASAFSAAPVKILFDATKAESAGNADWVIDADTHNLDWNPGPTTHGNESNPQRFPTPDQSTVTASTTDTYWEGSLSSWAIDCVKKGYEVETLPYNGQITYGNGSNLQDLSNYKVFIVDEPNILFSTAEKAAIVHFIQNGGSLFLISDHDQSDRNGDNHDSPSIWNDLITNNGVANNAFGFTFDLLNFSQTSTNIPNLSTDSIINGPMGKVTEVKWTNGTSMTLNPVQNASVKGVVYKTGSSFGNSNVLCTYARLGSGKVAAVSDSSIPDDGTGDPNDNLYNGYTLDASGNHRRLLMNITIWLATDNTLATYVPSASQAKDIRVFPNPATNEITVATDVLHVQSISLYNENGVLCEQVPTKNTSGTTDYFQYDMTALANGTYYCKIRTDESVITKKIILLK